MIWTTSRDSIAVLILLFALIAGVGVWLVAEYIGYRRRRRIDYNPRHRTKGNGT